MIVEVYNDKDSTTVIEQGASKYLLLDEPYTLIRTIEGTDWNDCMRQHFELMGWKPYKPMED